VHIEKFISDKEQNYIQHSIKLSTIYKTHMSLSNRDFNSYHKSILPYLKQQLKCNLHVIHKTNPFTIAPN